MPKTRSRSSDQEVGDSGESPTPEFLRLEFDRQDRLARAQLDELQAIANYNRALAAYHRATGTGPFLAGSAN